MPIEFELDPGAALIRAQFHGEITVEQLRDYNLSLRAHPDYRAGMQELIRLERIQPRIDFRQMASYRDWFVGLEPLRASAIVATDELAYGMARQFATLTGAGDQRIRVFRDEAAARAWLAESAPAP